MLSKIKFTMTMINSPLKQTDGVTRDSEDEHPNATCMMTSEKGWYLDITGRDHQCSRLYNSLTQKMLDIYEPLRNMYF